MTRGQEPRKWGPMVNDIRYRGVKTGAGKGRLQEMSKEGQEVIPGEQEVKGTRGVDLGAEQELKGRGEDINKGSGGKEAGESSILKLRPPTVKEANLKLKKLTGGVGSRLRPRDMRKTKQSLILIKNDQTYFDSKRVNVVSRKPVREKKGPEDSELNF